MSILLNFNRDIVACEMSEARLLDVQAIRPGNHVNKLVPSLVAGGLDALFLRAGVGEGDLTPATEAPDKSTTDPSTVPKVL